MKKGGRAVGPPPLKPYPTCYTPCHLVKGEWVCPRHGTVGAK